MRVEGGLLTPQSLQGVALVLFLVALPLLSLGTVEETELLWYSGLALIVLAGVLPIAARFVPEGEEGDGNDEDDGPDEDEGNDSRERDDDRPEPTAGPAGPRSGAAGRESDRARSQEQRERAQEDDR